MPIPIYSLPSQQIDQFVPSQQIDQFGREHFLHLLKQLMQELFAFAVGGFVKHCVARSVMGIDLKALHAQKSDIDLVTGCNQETVLAVLRALGIKIKKQTAGQAPYQYVEAELVLDQGQIIRLEIGFDRQLDPSNILRDLEKDALSPRDLTFNAIYLGFYGGQLCFIDPLGGIEDLHSKTARLIGDGRKNLTLKPFHLVRLLTTLSKDRDLQLAPESYEALHAFLSQPTVDIDIKSLFYRVCSRFHYMDDETFKGVLDYMKDNFDHPLVLVAAKLFEMLGSGTQNDFLSVGRSKFREVSSHADYVGKHFFIGITYCLDSVRDDVRLRFSLTIPKAGATVGDVRFAFHKELKESEINRGVPYFDFFMIEQEEGMGRPKKLENGTLLESIYQKMQGRRITVGYCDYPDHEAYFQSDNTDFQKNQIYIVQHILRSQLQPQIFWNGHQAGGSALAEHGAGSRRG